MTGSIATIIETVAAYYELTPAILRGPVRLRRYARPRQVAMFLAREGTSKSLPEIARAFGDRHHTTCMHAIKKVRRLLSLDDDVLRDVLVLRMALAPKPPAPDAPARATWRCEACKYPGNLTHWIECGRCGEWRKGRAA